MILDNAKLFKILTERPNKQLIDDAVKYTNKSLMHVKGVGLKKYIERISQFEPKDLIATRQKYAVSNKDLFARVLRPIDKVFSAKGGSAYYNLPDKKAEELKDYCKNIAFGYSARKWLQVFWMPALAYDPMGLIFIEVDKSGNPFPTYKSVLDIFDYQLQGRELEYVIFEKDAWIDRVKKEKNLKGKVYRVVDEVSDKIVELTSTGVLEVEGETYPNYFLEVPARIISDIYDPVKGFYISCIDDVIEKADQYLTQGSVKNIFKNYFGFPQYWTYQSACPECKGTKVLSGSDCTHCKGTGLKQRTDPSETTYLPVPQSKDQPLLAPNVGGFITPDIDGWDKMDAELKLLEDGIFQTLWGTQQVVDAKNNTATGKFIDVQPVNERLTYYSEAAEQMETFVINMVGSFIFQTKYDKASISYGKRYMIETPDELWTKYENARKNGAPLSSLDDLYYDYLQARYSSNNLELEKYLKLARVEPYKHYLLADLGRAPSEIANKKLFYADWIQTKTDAEIIITPVETLREDFEEYCEERMEKVKEATVEMMQQQQGQGGAAPIDKEEDDEEEEGKGAGAGSSKKTVTTEE